ncbi:MAG: hypothetical protein ABI165_03150 [Bryobacteraceae bacterium]
MADSKTPRHTAFAMKRRSKTRFIWLEIGTGRLDSNGVFHGIRDRLPVGGFTGYVYYAPIGEKPPDAEPERPGSLETEE